MFDTICTMNYKKEPFLNIDKTFKKRLDEIAAQINKQLMTPGEYLISNDYSKFGNKEFNKFWEHISINNPAGNKHSLNDYKGLYAFGEVVDGKLQVLYIGISQTIRRRFFAHSTAKKRNAATWAYKILKHQNPHLTKEEREALIPDLQNTLIKSYRFIFVKEDCNMIMHLAEAYCANKLKSYWNSFETH